MKGTFFQKSVEFRLVIEGETWHQGARIAGTIQVKNHGSEPVSLADLRLHLADGTDRKVKAKAEDAFEILATANPAPEGLSVAPGATSDAFQWEFTLDSNARITDKSGSLYVIYGRGEAMSGLGQLQLVVLPKVHFLDFVEVLEYTFRFVTKQKTAGKKGSVDVKMAPPSGKDHTSIENLVLSLRTDGEDLDVGFVFNVKEIDAMSAGLSLKKGKKSFERSFHPAQYLHAFNKRLNKDAIESAVAEIFQELKKGSILTKS